MGGNNLFQVLLASVKGRITPIVTRLKLYLNPSYIRSQIVTRFRKFLVEVFNVKPRDKTDYYGIFGWLISRRLAFAIVLVIGVLSLGYILNTKNALQNSAAGVKSYSYRSIPLRFKTGTVRIRGKGGYLAYEGNVEKGSVTGQGTLYNREGSVVYKGSFANNKYEGEGVSYYSDGLTQYSGAFSDNLYEGEGKLYRRNGSLEYSGEFVKGRKEGQGSLHDNGSNLVYTGTFANDEILYSDMLGMEAADIAEAYKGNRISYSMDDSIVVVMDDIDAVYLGQGNPDALDDANKVEQIAVLSNQIQTAGGACSTIDELREYFGAETYTGLSAITLLEAVAAEQLNEDGEATGYEDIIDVDASFDDYFSVEGLDSDSEVYLHSFSKDGLTYSFVCQDSSSPFIFYTIEQNGGAAG